MAVDIRWLGHACFELRSGGTTVLVDPFLSQNPKAAAAPDELEPDVILLTHGHFDHIGDTVDIARRSGATVVAVAEVASEIGGEGIDVRDPNIGGTVKFDWGWVKLTPAWHTGTTPGGTAHTAAGLLIHLGDRLVYHLGDTALFSDMQLVARRGDRVDAALVPIGGHYTMDRWDAVTAVEFINPRVAIPCHFGTFPPVESDPQAFKADVEGGGFAEQVVVLDPGDTHQLT
jgi:L-ascorbate metabolism protein UlaG (beta-lactamase superfamily)